MTQEEKSLLLKDISARLPYKVIVHFHDINVDDYDRQLIGEDLDFIELDRRNCKPYLRSMSSMTEEEKRELFEISCEGNIEYLYGFYFRCQDWLNANHFDYRGLIEKGLAIEVTKENNPYEI